MTEQRAPDMDAYGQLATDGLTTCDAHWSRELGLTTRICHELADAVTAVARDQRSVPCLATDLVLYRDCIQVLGTDPLRACQTLASIPADECGRSIDALPTCQAEGEQSCAAFKRALDSCLQARCSEADPVTLLVAKVLVLYCGGGRCADPQPYAALALRAAASIKSAASSNGCSDPACFERSTWVSLLTTLPLESGVSRAAVLRPCLDRGGLGYEQCQAALNCASDPAVCYGAPLPCVQPGGAGYETCQAAQACVPNPESCAGAPVPCVGDSSGGALDICRDTLVCTFDPDHCNPTPLPCLTPGEVAYEECQAAAGCALSLGGCVPVPGVPTSVADEAVDSATDPVPYAEPQLIESDSMCTDDCAGEPVGSMVAVDASVDKKIQSGDLTLLQGLLATDVQRVPPVNCQAWIARKAGRLQEIQTLDPNDPPLKGWTVRWRGTMRCIGGTVALEGLSRLFRARPYGGYDVVADGSEYMSAGGGVVEGQTKGKWLEPSTRKRKYVLWVATLEVPSPYSWANKEPLGDMKGINERKSDCELTNTPYPNTPRYLNTAICSLYSNRFK